MLLTRVHDIHRHLENDQQDKLHWLVLVLTVHLGSLITRAVRGRRRIGLVVHDGRQGWGTIIKIGWRWKRYMSWLASCACGGGVGRQPWLVGTPLADRPVWCLQLDPKQGCGGEYLRVARYRLPVGPARYQTAFAQCRCSRRVQLVGYVRSGGGRCWPGTNDVYIEAHKRLPCTT